MKIWLVCILRVNLSIYYKKILYNLFNKKKYIDYKNLFSKYTSDYKYFSS